MSAPTRAWRVWVSDAARDAMIKAAASAHPKETGGVLAGVMLARERATCRPWVTHAVEVRSRKSGPAHYELPAGARERVVKKLRKNDPRLGYLGDWHTHPADLDPSRTDADSMASASATGDCRRPLLLVVRRAADGYQIDARQWTGATLRRLQLRGTGPLARASDARGIERRVVTLPRVRRIKGSRP